MLVSSLKKLLLSDCPRPMRILRGPFRGATILMSPRDSLRKVFGIYEYELNDWIEHALRRVDTVLDIGANDGYFTFGCAAAFGRSGKAANIIAFEPRAAHCDQLRASVRLQSARGQRITFSVEEKFVGKDATDNQTTLDALVRSADSPLQPRRTLVKIDVEGAEVDVIKGATQWLNPSNYFLIEVHHESYLEVLRDHFASAGILLKQISQRPLPLLGRESRSVSNWWLVTPLI